MPSLKESVLLLHYGQSNADVHHAGPAGKEPFFQNERVVMPNDRVGFRGWMGAKPLEPITGFVPSHTPLSLDIQSIGAAAGACALDVLGSKAPARIIIRSEGKGGRRFIGGHGQDGLFLDEFGDASPSYKNLISSTLQIAEVSEKDGMPVRHIYIHFAHQESDRGDTRTAYLSKLQNFISEVELDLSHLGIPVTWLLSQAGGTAGAGNGNSWPNRLTLRDMEASKDNVYLISARYHLGLVDEIHLSADAKASFGETLGHAIAALEQSKPFYPPRLSKLTRHKDNLIAEFDTLSPLQLDDTQHAIPVGNYGFELHRCPDAEIAKVTCTGENSVMIEIDGVLPEVNASLRYAFHNNNIKSDQIDYIVGAGGLRDSWEEASIGLPDVQLYRWALSFEEPI